MKKLFLLLSFLLFGQVVKAQDNVKELSIRTRIDSVYVFGFNTKESRDAKGGIWNLKTGLPETPQNYSKAEPDTIGGQPVVRLYRQVVWGKHPLNDWEVWVRRGGKWIFVGPTEAATPEAIRSILDEPAVCEPASDAR